jgi:hypothetical protein
MLGLELRKRQTVLQLAGHLMLRDVRYAPDSSSEGD